MSYIQDIYQDLESLECLECDNPKCINGEKIAIYLDFLGQDEIIKVFHDLMNETLTIEGLKNQYKEAVFAQKYFAEHGELPC